MVNHNKTSSSKANIYSSINDLVVFKIANLDLDYSYKKSNEISKSSVHKKPILSALKLPKAGEIFIESPLNSYEEFVIQFFKREIINYACRISPPLSDSFWGEDTEDGKGSHQMRMRFESNFKKSKIKVQDKRNNKTPITALKNLRKIEFFTTQTMLEAVTIERSRDFDIIHSYLVDTQKRIRGIFDTIIEYAIIDWRKELRASQPSLQKNLIIHLFHLDRLSLIKPELSLRIRECETKKTFPEKSDCKSAFFYANKLEENKYCSKRCKIDFQNFQDINPHSKSITKKIRRRKF